MRSSNPVLGRAFNQRGYAAFDPSTINSDPAARALTSGEQNDGWKFWAVKNKSGLVTLQELLASK